MTSQQAIAQALPTPLEWLRAAADDQAVFADFPELGEEISFAAAIDTGRRVAHVLRELGVTEGDRVVVVMGNRPEFIGAWLGATLANACLVPLNPEMPAEQLSGLRDRLDAAATFLADGDDVVVEHRGGSVPYSSHAEHPPLAWDEIPTPAPGDITWMLFTGGTTGTPKGILLSQRFVRIFAEYWATSGRLAAGDVHLQDLPFHHANGLMGLLMSFPVHRRLVVYGRFSVSRYWERVRASGATTTSWLGTMGHLVTKRPEASPSRMDRVKWVPRPPDIRAIEERLGLQVIESYGATEGGMCAWTDAESGPVGCGHAHAPYRIGIEAEDGTALTAPGQVGEIVVRCDEDWHMCSGYWRDGVVDLHETGLHEWRSGDLGERLEDGTFRVVGRKTGDIIRHKGENISAREIEIAALQHPAVVEAAAVGLQIDGSAIMLVCRLQDGAELAPPELSSYLAERLIKQARPRFIAFAAELPKTVKEIVPKRELQRFHAGSWDAEAGR